MLVAAPSGQTKEIQQVSQLLFQVFYEHNVFAAEKTQGVFFSVFELLIQAFFLFVCFLFVVFGLFFVLNLKRRPKSGFVWF